MRISVVVPVYNEREVLPEFHRRASAVLSALPGMDYEIAYDVSKFVDASIDKVIHTLLEACILVSLVVFAYAVGVL